MPHIKGYPMAGHEKKRGKVALDREIRVRPRAQAWIDDEAPSYSTPRDPAMEGANICEEAGDCADRVNREELSPEAKQILRDAERVA